MSAPRAPSAPRGPPGGPRAPAGPRGPPAENIFDEPRGAFDTSFRTKLSTAMAMADDGPELLSVLEDAAEFRRRSGEKISDRQLHDVLSGMTAAAWFTPAFRLHLDAWFELNSAVLEHDDDRAHSPYAAAAAAAGEAQHAPPAGQGAPAAPNFFAVIEAQNGTELLSTLNIYAEASLRSGEKVSEYRVRRLLEQMKIDHPEWFTDDLLRQLDQWFHEWRAIVDFNYDLCAEVAGDTSANDNAPAWKELLSAYVANARSCGDNLTETSIRSMIGEMKAQNTEWNTPDADRQVEEWFAVNRTIFETAPVVVTQEVAPVVVIPETVPVAVAQQDASGNSSAHQARTLGRVDSFSVKTLHIKQGKNLLPADVTGKSDPYVRVQCGEAMFKTKIVKKNLNPTWNETFSLPADAKTLTIDVFDHDTLTEDDHIGHLQIEVLDMVHLREPKWYPLKVPQGFKPRTFNVDKSSGGEILLQITRE